jgi:glutathione synthase
MGAFMKKLGIISDPLSHFNRKKDSTLAMLEAAAARGIMLYHMELKDIFLKGGEVYAQAHRITLKLETTPWFELAAPERLSLTAFDAVLMRKDPPFDMEYIHATYLLEQAERGGALIINKPRSLRDANEKLYTAWFSDYCPPTCVARDIQLLKEFLGEQQEVIFKPLGGMGGLSVFKVTKGDPNTSVILETLTQNGTQFIMAQRYIPEISQGDKRILLINGEAVPYALARVPAPGETRGNLAAGATGVGVALSARDKEIVAAVGPHLRERGLLFVGLDVIGDYLTEINVTSPTCIRELEALYHLDIAASFLDCVADYAARH